LAVMLDILNSEYCIKLYLGTKAWSIKCAVAALLSSAISCGPFRLQK
jgi:hypothetical protein